MKNLELDLLRTFLTISRNNTFAEAAESMHRTQSAITQQMQRLEEIAGGALFTKVGRKKTLTELGIKLVGYARQIISLNDEALISMQGQSVAGQLRLGAPHDIAETILTPLLKHIARFSPNIELEIRVDRSPFLMDALRANEIDLTISTRFDPQLEGVVLRRSPTAWICSSDYVHEPSHPIPLILVGEPSIFRKMALTALEEANNVRWHISYVAPNLVGIKAAVRAGLGVTARSIELLEPDMRVLGEQDGLPPLPDTSFYLWKIKNPINSMTQHVYRMLKASMGLT